VSGSVIDPLSVDAAVAQRLDEQPDRAAGVERRLGMEVLDETIGDLAEEVEPEGIALVADTGGGIVSVVVSAVVARHGALTSGRCLALTRRQFVVDRIRCAPHPGAC